MPRKPIPDSDKLIHNLAVKFCARDLERVQGKAKKAGYKKPGTWAREVLLKA